MPARILAERGREDKENVYFYSQLHYLNKKTMNIKKRTVWFILLLCVIVMFAGWIFQINLVRNNTVEEANLIRVKSLDKGMDESEVRHIMGIPELVDSSNSDVKVYHYKSDNVDYLDIEVYLNNENKVTEIFIPRN